MPAWLNYSPSSSNKTAFVQQWMRPPAQETERGLLISRSTSRSCNRNFVNTALNDNASRSERIVERKPNAWHKNGHRIRSGSGWKPASALERVAHMN